MDEGVSKVCKPLTKPPDEAPGTSPPCNYFRCVLVDDDVVDLLNAVLRQEEKYRMLEASSVSEGDLSKIFKGDGNLMAAWKAAEKAKIDAEMKEVVREKQQIQWTSSRTPKVLIHVRNCVEEYIHRFQETVSMDETIG
ncbi:MAG: hypothetical protein ABI163_15755 [Thermoanaerobaculia bacterium]